MALALAFISLALTAPPPADAGVLAGDVVDAGPPAQRLSWHMLSGVDVDNGGAGRTPDELARRVNSALAANTCLGDATTAAVMLTATLTLRDDGAVAAVGINQRASTPAVLIECMQAALSRIRFERSATPLQHVKLRLQASTAAPRMLGSLDKEIIRGIVRDHAPEIRACYESALTRTPGIAGKIKLKWVVDGTGAVREDIELELAAPGMDDVVACLRARIRAWKFPKPKGGGIVIISYPFVFKQSP